MMVHKTTNLFNRIRSFFKSIFRHHTLELPEQSTYEEIEKNKIKVNNLKENIKIRKDEEETRLMIIQKKVQSGKIHVEELDEIDFEKIYDLYDRQIKDIKQSTEELNKSTENYKNEIIEIRKKLTNYA